MDGNPHAGPDTIREALTAAARWRSVATAARFGRWPQGSG